MGTIANRKDGSNIQLEIQGIGTSQASIMLQQPLLGESSENYTVEVTDFQMSLGEERATSKIYSRPIMLIIDYSEYGYDLDFDGGVNGLDFSIYENALDSGANILDAWYAATRDFAGSPDKGIVQIDGIRSYSATDWVLQLSQQIETKTDGRFEFGVTPSGQFHIISRNYVVSDPDGNISDSVGNKLEDHLIVIDRSMQALTGLKDVLYGYHGQIRTTPLNVLTDENDLDSNWKPFLKEDDENYIVSLFSNQDDLAWETLDRRKRVRIDLSLPVGLTMGWKSTQQEKVYLLQEFDIPKGRSTCSFNSSRVANPSCSIREKQLVSTTNFVGGGGKMAVQKLFPGPVQALRLSLVLIYAEFDYKKQQLVEKSKNIEMGSGDFFYLKILFSKEST